MRYNEEAILLVFLSNGVSNAELLCSRNASYTLCGHTPSVQKVRYGVMPSSR